MEMFIQALARALKKEDQVYGEMLAETAKVHSSEAFYALDETLEAAVSSVMLVLCKSIENSSDLELS